MRALHRLQHAILGFRLRARRCTAALAAAATATIAALVAVPAAQAVPQPPSASSPSPQQIAQAMLAGYGWGQDQWGCLDQLWQLESGWSVTAENPFSGAYGIPQAVPGSKMASAGPDWQTDAATQITWGLGYIQRVYGTPCAAWLHEESAGYY